jgi:hypothetical protein
MKSIGKILVVLAVVVWPALATADFPPCEVNPYDGSIADLHQEGQDVHMRAVIDSVPECQAELYANANIWRRSSGANRWVDRNNPVEGVELVDLCVPPGLITYNLSSYWWDNGNMNVCLATTTIVVTDSGSGCEPLPNEDPTTDYCSSGVDDDSADDDTTPPIDDDLDDDHDDDMDDDATGPIGDDDQSAGDDDNSSSCGGCEAARENPAPVLAAVMFAIGFAALAFARRKR